MKVKAGETAPESGTYKCTRCGYKIQLNKGDTVPVCPKCGNKVFEFIG
jgi:DNA-directed RNA polymerase subunit RPC12/RpoP